MRARHYTFRLDRDWSIERQQLRLSRARRVLTHQLFRESPDAVLFDWGAEPISTNTWEVFLIYDPEEKAPASWSSR